MRLHHEHEAGKLKPAESPSAEDEVTSREAVERLYASIDSLPEPLRVAVHLRAVEGFSLREIALVTGLPLGTVGSRIRKAREELRRLLGGQHLAVAWANLELARKQAWFPAATDGLSRATLERLRRLVKPARTMIAPAAFVAVAALAALGVSAPWVLEGPPVVSPRSEVTAPQERRGVEVNGAAPSVAASETREKPIAPVVAGAETGISEARGGEPETERPGDPDARESEGGESMTGTRTLLASAALAVGVAAAIDGAETGDIDGDGRLTIADVLYLEDGLEPAEGSLAGFESFPCYLEQGGDPDRTLWLENMVPSTIYLESLRRGVDGSLAHWDGVWSEDIVAEPLPADARCEIELLPSTAPGGSIDRARLHLRLTVLAPVRSFSLVLEAPPGLLEAPPGGFRGVGPWFDTTRWRRKYEVLGANRQMHRFGDLEVAVTAQAYLITGGRYVVSYDLLDNVVWDDIQPGEYLVTIEARVAQHTPGGTYPIKVLPASEILFRDGTVSRPVVLTDNELRIENDVTEGLDDGVPPLELDGEDRRVLGDVEFRLVDGDGNPAEPGEPVAEALNDEQVSVRLQLRTEVPLNEIRYDLRWRTEDGLDLKCESPPPVLFSRPDGTEYGPYNASELFPERGNHCGTIFGIGQAEGVFRLAGSDNTEFSNNRPERPLEYFRPLGAWLDVLELRLTVPDEAVVGKEIALRFSAEGSGLNGNAAFIPYGAGYPCHPDLWPEDKTYWKYNVIYHDSFIRVLGDGEPPAPPDLGLRFALGTASGVPGELVEVPIQAASLVPLRRIRLALKLDSAILSVEEVEMDVLDLATDTIVREQCGRGGFVLRWVCTDENGDGRPESCTGGVPSNVRFQDTDPSFILLDIFPGDPLFPYPGNVDGRLVEIGRLRLRIAEDARPGETFLSPARVPWTENTFETIVESGGNTREGGAYTPATEVVEGTVVIEDRAARRDLVRGDANVDGEIDISDAVLMLNSLFTVSRPLTCEDAADADDNGVLNITDPILLLGVLFGGEGALPAPSSCASDPTIDALGCEEGCSAG